MEHTRKFESYELAQLQKQEELAEAALLSGFIPEPVHRRLECVQARGEFVPFRRPPLKATLYLGLESPLWYLEFDDVPLWFRGETTELMADTLSRFCDWGQA